MSPVVRSLGGVRLTVALATSLGVSGLLALLGLGFERPVWLAVGFAATAFFGAAMIAAGRGTRLTRPYLLLAALLALAVGLASLSVVLLPVMLVAAGLFATAGSESPTPSR